ncbi:DUF4153 domain-containing protein [Paenibacillus sp. GCM10027626]|uniref:DUF4153 domain-containing protein n=1 Tax=Paenibacillus sp. GCM10027626 TaxID=3273411 RepID=UPI00363DFD13
MRDPAPWQKRYDRLLLYSILLGLAGQYLFVGNDPGVSVILFIIGYYAVFFYAVRGRIGGFEQWRGQSKSGWLLFIPIGLLALTYMLFANSLFRTLNAVVLPAMMIAQALLLTRSSPYPWYKAVFFGDLLNRAIAKPISYIAVPFELIGSKLMPAKASYSVNGKLRSVLLGLLLAAPVLIVVIALLAAADGIFLSWLVEIPGWFGGFSVGGSGVRILVAAVLSLYIFCFLWGLLFHNGDDMRAVRSRAEGGAVAEQPLVSLDPVTAGTLFTTVNIVYLLFAVIQFSYFFGAAQGMLPEGEAYADYARRGFSELVLVAVINMGLLHVGLHVVRPAGRKAERFRKLLLSMLVLCTFVMLISAFSRLSLYEEAYGFTQTRLLVHGFMIYLGSLLTASFIRIWRVRLSLTKVYIGLSVLAFVIMNYINIDARIAVNNIERYERTGVIDIDYLGTLSADAAPALMKLQQRNPEWGELQELIVRMKASEKERGSWPSWNLSIYRLE